MSEPGRVELHQEELFHEGAASGRTAPARRTELSEADRDWLHQAIDRLPSSDAAVVEQFVRAVLAPVNQELDPGSWLASPRWAQAFLARLRAHHALSTVPLSTTAFESAFNAASMESGWTVEAASSSTNRFFDTRLGRPGEPVRKLSLKATASKDLRADRIHISKLTEAAWIQDARTHADRRDKLVELFAEYRRQTDAIVVLRCFRHRAPARLHYELVEVPTSVFASVGLLNVTEAQLGTIPIPPGVPQPDARIRIDRSDAKITVTGIRLAVCTVHGRWSMSTDPS